MTLSFSFSLPLPLRGVVTLLPPVVGGSLVQPNLVVQGSKSRPSLARDSGWGKMGIPFCDFRNACENIDGGITGTPGVLPTSWTCSASSHALSLSALGSEPLSSWRAFTNYSLVVKDVPAGATTGAVALYVGLAVPSFRLMAIDTKDSIQAMGSTMGWLWITQLRITYLWMKRPLLDTFGTSALEVAAGH